MTPEEKLMSHIYEESIRVANKIGPLIVEETQGRIPVIATSTAFLFANFCIKANISLHDSIDLLMSTYKETLALMEEEE